MEHHAPAGASTGGLPAGTGPAAGPFRDLRIRASSTLLERRIVRWGLLWVLIAHQIAVSAVWLALDTSPPGWDQSIPLVKSLMLQRAFAADGLRGLSYAFPAVDRWQPSLLGLSMLPAYALGGVGPDVAVAVNHLAVVVMALALYGLGCRLAGPAAGLVAVFAAGTMPLLFGLSRQSYPEFGLAAVTTGSLYCLVRSEDLRRRAAGVILGVGLGLGALLKMSAPVFLMGALLVSLIRRSRAAAPSGRAPGSRARATLALDLAAVALPAALIAAPWYVPNLASGLAYASSAAYGHVATLENFGPVWSPLTLVRFLDLFVAWGPSYYYGLLLIALFAVPAVPGPSPVRPLLVASVTGALVVFSTAVNKDIRYLAPVLPSLALLLGDRLARAWEPWPRGWRIALLLVPLANLYMISFTTPGTWHDRPGVMATIVSGLGAGFFTYPPRTADWRTEEIVRALDRHADGMTAFGQPVSVLVTTNHRAFHKDLFNYVSLSLGRAYRFEPLPHYDPDPNLAAMLRALERAELVVGTSGWQGPAYASRWNSEIHGRLDRGELPFVRVPVAIRLPDQSDVLLYRRVARERERSNPGHVTGAWTPVVSRLKSPG